MAITDDTAEREPETPWGTWEELLLACAVHRYGTQSWDSVAVEIQKRSSASTLHHLLTPHNCEQRYHDLKRRYAANGKGNDTVSKSDDFNDGQTETIPWLDELRKLRVAQLKHELERYDLSIVSLQLKVKKLKEEREQSSRESEKDREKSDLERSVEREIKEEKREEDGEPEKLSPGSVAGKPVSGEESDRENQSVNESNSTDPKVENLETGQEGAAEKETEPVGTGDEKPDPVGGSTKPAGEDSCNGSSDSIAKESAREPVKIEQEGGESESPELLESVAESKGGNEEGAKENSDVQSSASLSRQKGRDKLRAGACSSGEEPENEDHSPASKGVSVKSQPLIDFLESIRSQKLGSLFERRLESQETPMYTNLIRQHIDLETIQTRIEEGWYLGCNRKFFRDLLLLVNNTIVFFGKNTSESAAAIDLWQLVSKEMSQKKDNSDLSLEERPSLPPVPLPFKSDPEPSAPLLLKPKMSVPMIVCRKRSSIAAKASGSASGADKKREQTPALAEEKSVPDWKLPYKTSGNAEEQITKTKTSGNAEEQITKTRTRERIASGSRSSRKNSKSRTNTNANKNSEASLSQNQGKGGSPGEHSEARSEKKNTTTTTTTGVNKRSAATFLNRISRSSSLHNGSLLDTLKNSAISSDNNKGGTGQKRSGNARGDVRKEQVTRRSSAGRQAKEQVSPAKRSVGRPPKGAAAPPPTQPAVSGKRSREVGETEAVASKQPKKRSRK